MNTCACDCGSPVNKTFRMGHDVRVAGRVVRAAVAGELINGRDPVEYAAGLFGPAGQAKIARSIAKHRDGATEWQPAPDVKKGRWLYPARTDGKVTQRNSRRDGSGDWLPV